MPVFWWTELDFVSLRGSAISPSVLGGVSGFGMSLGSLSSNVQSCGPILLKDGCVTDVRMKGEDQPVMRIIDTKYSKWNRMV